MNGFVGRPVNQMKPIARTFAAPNNRINSIPGVSVKQQRRTCLVRAEAKPYVEVSPEEAASLLNEKRYGVFLDVRTPEEFARGHSEGAINVPLKLIADGAMVDNPDFEKQIEATLGDKKDVGVVCTCFGGGRGGVAAGKLASAGFTSVSNLVGGMGAWAKEDLPVTGEIKPPFNH